MNPQELSTVILEERLALRPGVYSVRDGRRVHLVAGHHAEALGELEPALRTALHALTGRAQTVDELCAFPDDDGIKERATEFLDRLRTRGWLSISVSHYDRPLYTLVPGGHPPEPLEREGPPSDAVLSRFALLRRATDGYVLESPRSWCTVEVHDLVVLAAVGADSANVEMPGMSVEVAARLRRDLWWAGMLTPSRGREDGEFRLRQWSAHELWFHDRTRIERRDRKEGFGGTRWAQGNFPPLPAVHEPFDGPVVELSRPDLSALRASDPTLSATLEDRRTIRAHGDDGEPLTASQLGEFLYRCCRDRGRYLVGSVEHVSRPYPAAGAAYELEVYPVVRRVDGLVPGVYHYRPDRHELTLVRSPSPASDRMLRVAMQAAGSPSLPQVLLVISARFGRVMWKYEAFAYSLILKDVGALYQVMYLVATAMNLAPCGLGAGDTMAFTRVTGLDPLVEDSVGEFLLGSRPSGAPRLPRSPDES